ncbi:ACS family glucarate transporter-like MFS transporter [Serratia fonticola]|uniref:ACS family glucarate transporter-like MFS transporter n=1 Tax=Serratia fonticola TaxID=47917 RepID=A0A542BJX9_SERFO|nr:MFS transporter [Serratia fonticola]TQI78878.1 ACS family glucarate transporter-like MFS transporter [Serratia fonticola]TQI99099.1 ACS family glucarate transporter-like MFS transporter [Serratia fonticola]TVZ68624.1 ACS family glucarate transporter-like MFS transporter [Serratia fonticola]
MSTISTASSAIKRTNKRYWIVVMLFIVTSFNYGDRATLSIAGTSMAEDIGLDPVGMGYIFSAFSWAYVIGQIPGGWLLDRFGSKRVYFWSIFIWSLFTLLQGFVDLFSGFGIVMALFALRFLVGLAEAPSFPGNSRIVAAWFPAHERGTAVAIFNSAQYFATVIFAPIMGWLTHAVGWSHVFFFMGGLGIILSFIWLKVLHDPKDHPSINQAELDYIEAGGALINMDQKQEKQTKVKGEKWFQIKQLLRSRMMVGVYIGQYCINGLTYFFITWFPVYLVQARGMSILKAGFVASVPAICGFIGGVLGGVISDYLMRRTQSLTFARKTPIVLGMLLSMSMIFCNYVETEWMVVGIMAAAFFGKGLGALGWAVMADTAPKEISGLSGGLFNMFGNISGIVTPIAIGYIIGTTGSFNGALVYVGIHALLAVASYLFIVGDIKRIELKPMAKASRQ